MEFYTDSKILQILEKDYKQFKRILLDLDDKYLEDFKDKPKMFNVFMFGIVNDNKALSTIIKKMVKEGCNQKEVSKFFYKYLKMNYKTKTGKWSWNEIEDFDIDLEDIKETTTKYCFI
jgi:hypothetical protein